MKMMCAPFMFLRHKKASRVFSAYLRTAFHLSAAERPHQHRQRVQNH